MVLDLLGGAAGGIPGAAFLGGSGGLGGGASSSAASTNKVDFNSPFNVGSGSTAKASEDPFNASIKLITPIVVALFATLLLVKILGKGR